MKQRGEDGSGQHEEKPMSFNLKDYLQRAAAKVPSVTEAQLGNDGKGSNQVTERQLDKGRKDEKPATTERRLNKVRAGDGTRRQTGVGDMFRNLMPGRGQQAEPGWFSPSAKRPTPSDKQRREKVVRRPLGLLRQDRERRQRRRDHSCWDREDRLEAIHAGRGQEGMTSRTAKAPKGWKKTVEKMKKHKEIDNPFALANWMDEEGCEPHPHKKSSAAIRTADGEVVPRFRNFYRCPNCRIEWQDEWDSMCNDHCPQCDAEIEPYDSEDIEPRGMATAAARAVMKLAEKVDLDAPTEQRLRKKDDSDAPDALTEKQIDKDRTDGDAVPTEKRLEKVRTGAAEVLVEKMLDDSDSKLVKHRNAEAHTGDMNKVEEQRLANKDRQDTEEAKAASTTEKALSFKEVKGPDGLRTASTINGVVRTAQSSRGRSNRRTDRPSSIDDSRFDIGTGEFFRGEGMEDPYEDDPYQSLSPSDPETMRHDDEDDLDFEIGEKGEEGIGMVDAPDVDLDARDLIEDVSKGAPPAPAAELDAIEREETAGFTEVSSQDIDQGGTTVRQITLEFEPLTFANRQDAQNKAVEWVAERNPGVDMDSLIDNIVMDFQNGRAVFTIVPQAALDAERGVADEVKPSRKRRAA